MKLATIVILLIIPLLTRAQKWELAKVKDGITVYTRESDDMPIKEFRAEAEYDFSSVKLIETIKDVAFYHLWHDHYKSTEILSQENHSIIFYTEVYMPFPFDNRDVVSEMSMESKGDSTFLRFNHKNGIKAEVEGIVRIPHSEAVWTVIRLSEKETRLIYQFKGDPAGNIPSGVINMFLVSGPLNTLTQLRTYIAEKYSD